MPACPPPPKTRVSAGSLRSASRFRKLRARTPASHASFLVRKKTFAYYLANHHGDGIVAACFKVALGGNADLVASDPARFYLPAYIGPRGWVAFRLAAPKRLAALV